MAKIPDRTSLGSGPRLAATQAISIAPQQASRADEIEAEGLRQLGGSVQNFGTQLGSRMKQRKDKRNYSKAKTLLMTTHIETINSFQDDPDYETFGERYSDKMQEAKKEAGELISGSHLQQLFSDEAELQIERGGAELGKVSWAREKDSARADLQGLIDQNRELSMQTNNPETRMGLIQDTLEAINTTRDDGLIDQTTAQKLHQTTGTDFAIASISLMSAQDQESVLKSGEGVAEFIPADKRQDMIDKIDKRGISQGHTDVIMSSGLDDDAMISEAKKIKDPKLRDDVLSRVKTNINTRKALEKAEQDKAFDEAKNVVFETNDFDSIPEDTFAAMSGDQKLKLRDYLENRAAKEANGRKTDEWDVVDEVDKRIASGDITDTEQLAEYEPYLRDATIRAKRKAIQQREKVSTKVMQRAFEDRTGKTRAKWNTTMEGQSVKLMDQWPAFQEYILDQVKETNRPEDVNVWADKWFMEGYGDADTFWFWNETDPATFGEAKVKGRKDFTAETPDVDLPTVNQSLEIIRNQGFNLPEGSVARDEFYTDYYIEGQRYLNAQEYPVTPSSLAAYAILKQSGKKITMKAIDKAVGQIND